VEGLDISGQAGGPVICIREERNLDKERTICFQDYLRRPVSSHSDESVRQDLSSLELVSEGDFYGGLTGRPETMCPRTNVLGLLVPKLIVPCDTMSLD